MTSANDKAGIIKHVLSAMKTIAVVGLSADPSKDSHQVARYLKEHGYKIIPVNPGAEEILGEKSYPDLKSIGEPVDVVDVFRRPEHVPDIAEQAVAVGSKVLWLQLGIESEDGAAIARKGGLSVIQNACMMQEHRRFAG